MHECERKGGKLNKEGHCEYPKPDFDFDKYEYRPRPSNDWTFADLYRNKTLQENLKDIPIYVKTDIESKYARFDRVGYSREHKSYYLAWKKQSKPSGALTGTQEGKMFVKSKFDTDMRISKVQRKLK